MASQSESSFEITPFQPEARSANELWCQLQPDGTDGSHQQTSISNCQLGHFRVEEQIGRGGMGAVYRAVDTRLDRVVALKVLSPSQSNDFGSVERFRNEARAAARMDHDNIARVYYVGEDQGLWFIAFEFVHGG
ncbi:MAG: protein kinase, partial [Planctomycetaceae bacterium]|nr:protein kinase [Planctomycetaceae bacterium]